MSRCLLVAIHPHFCDLYTLCPCLQYPSALDEVVGYIPLLSVSKVSHAHVIVVVFFFCLVCFLYGSLRVLLPQITELHRCVCVCVHVRCLSKGS